MNEAIEHAEALKSLAQAEVKIASLVTHNPKEESNTTPLSNDTERRKNAFAIRKRVISSTILEMLFRLQTKEAE